MGLTMPLPVVQAGELAIEEIQERWLIRSVWGRSAVGIIGGPPKTFKTWFGLEMAVSVASGIPFLEKFPVDHRGRSLVYLAEDALPQIRARISAICAHRGPSIGGIDLHVITAPSLRLDVIEQQERLQTTLERYRPRLLVLDPLVRLHRLDENNATEMSGLLGYLRTLQRDYDMAIALVHHSSKRANGHAGQALRGSSDLHAWTDSSVYLSRGENAEQVKVLVEHRAAKAPAPVLMELVSDVDELRAHLEVKGEIPTEPASPAPATSLAMQVLKVLQKAGRAVKRAELRGELRVNNERLGSILIELEKHGRVRRAAQGWAYLPPAAGPPPPSNQGTPPLA